MRIAPWIVLLSLVQACAPAQTPGDGKEQVPSDFVRWVVEGDGGHLDTAITTYRKDGTELLLFGAVHIGDAALYATLNDRFTTCDVLLYELVAPPDVRPTKDREESGFSPISILQKGLRNALELSFQLDEIDYQAANFVHADMSPQEFETAMAERGESLLSIMFDMMMQGAQQQRDADGEAPQKPFDLVAAFRKGEGRHLLRTTFAAQMEQIELMAAGGKSSTLLEGRNEKCLQVLQRELAKGHHRIGIYYGAAHFPHMEQRLVRDLGFQKTGHEWLVAWDCKKRPDVKYDRALVQARQRCREEMEQIGSAARAYMLKHGRDPVPTLEQLVASDVVPYQGSAKDPWGCAYVLRKRPVGTRIEVASAGPDGVLGSPDDLTLVEARRGGLR
jgi:hypothetical protein